MHVDMNSCGLVHGGDVHDNSSGVVHVNSGVRLCTRIHVIRMQLKFGGEQSQWVRVLGARMGVLL